MFFVQNVILAVVDLLAIVLNLYFWVVIVAAVLSWVRPDPYNPVVRALRTLTEPVFYRVRKWLPFTYTNGIDFSPAGHPAHQPHRHRITGPVCRYSGVAAVCRNGRHAGRRTSNAGDFLWISMKLNSSNSYCPLIRS